MENYGGDQELKNTSNVINEVTNKPLKQERVN